MLFLVRAINLETFFSPILKFELYPLILMSPKKDLCVLFALGFTQLGDKINEQQQKKISGIRKPV